MGFKNAVSLYPPFFAAGIKVTKVNPDFRLIETTLKAKWYNRNLFNTHFGGSLYAMTDPFHVVMLQKNLGDQYLIWDIGAEIKFDVATAKPISALFELTKKEIEEVKLQLSSTRKILRNYHIVIKEIETGRSIASVKKTIYIRKKKVKKLTK